MTETHVSDVMEKAVRSGPSSVPVAAAVTEFARHDIGSIVAVDEETGELKGMVAKSDIFEVVSEGADLSAVSLGDIMSTPVVTIASDESVVTAAERMEAHSVRRLPVVEEGDLVGVVTTKDLTHHIPELVADDRPRHEARNDG